MKKFSKKYVREIRDGLNRYPAWPIQQQLQLGSIACYHGRTARFEWITSLDELGISLNYPAAQAVISEFYTTDNGVDLEFSASPGAATCQANFQFRKNNAIATQSYELSHRSVPLESLRRTLTAAIETGQLQWNNHWLILTELWASQGFTALVAAGRQSAFILKANCQTPGTAFNVANMTLDLQISTCRRMSYHAVAKQHINPYFRVHKLVYQAKKRVYRLKAYGDSSC